ncbi:PspC domain-containing protein [Mucilaginibacter sp. OK098]|uniref:PspC domain-containing protein n=1 Tax=Mucilaginibacter sp. OK098 TaxID=1855297 RepID=UPI0009140D08|nr:PspC domain-containing protein [Mucilaginibacter sp. OK098]SHM81568.1 phage shock protein C (PspC) family protein [Mucilaginibacter sp. OK098]
MNKTIIININGIVFHIEEDAYEILKNYMTDVKRHFSNSADSLEITTDIENRIAEMFSEALEKENKQVIVEQDVNSIVEQMGSVADFESAEGENNSHTTTNAYNTEGRRLFRDPDDHLVAGVCSGIANYFNIDAVWIRLAFALFTPVGGTGFLLYIILWIVVPKAVSRADKMAMKGEKQNLQGFKKNLEDELSSVRQNLSNFGHEARPFVYKARDFVGDFFHHLGIFFNGAGRVFIKLLGVAILLAAFAAAIFLVVVFVGTIGFGAEFGDHILPFRMASSELADNVLTAGFLTALIPLITIILATIKGIFNVGSIGRSTGTVLLVLWLCSLGMLIFYATKIASGFREQASFTETVNLKLTKNNTYYLKLNDIKYFSHDDSVRLDIKNHFRNMVVTDENYNGFHSEPRSVTLYIEKSDVNHPVLEESFRANGGNYEAALFNARNTSYIFAQQDTVLKFDYTLRKRPNALWHAEEVVLTLKLPLNAKVIIDQKLDNYLQDVNLYDCRNLNKTDNKATSSIFNMTDNGLQCKVDTIVTAKKDSVRKDSVKKDSAQ